MSYWVITGLGVLFLLLLALWRGINLEKIRLASLSLSCEVKNPLDNRSTVIARAAEFEDFIRNGKKKAKAPENSSSD